MMDTGTPINLSKAQRCDQRWHGMPVIPGGRLCGQCDKRIVDFTAMSHAEVARIHLESDVPVCGMYRDDQLAPPRRSAAKDPILNAHPVVLSLVSLLLMEPTPSLAQEHATELVMPNARSPMNTEAVTHKGTSTADTVLVRGTVLENGEPVPFVTVVVKDTDLGTITDIDGHFVLDVTELSSTQPRAIVVVYYIGYSKQEMEVDLAQPGAVLFRLDEGEPHLTVYSVTYKKPPLHKRIWWGLQRPFRKR